MKLPLDLSTFLGGGGGEVGGDLSSTDSIGPLDWIGCLDGQLITVISLLVADLVNGCWMWVCQCWICWCQGG